MPRCPCSIGWQGRAELAAGLEYREPDTETRAIDARRARAAAAAERNQVLPGLWIEAEDGPRDPGEVEYRRWEALRDRERCQLRSR